jgi:hypothetical protein
MRCPISRSRASAAISPGAMAIRRRRSPSRAQVAVGEAPRWMPPWVGHQAPPVGFGRWIGPCGRSGRTVPAAHSGPTGDAGNGSPAAAQPGRVGVAAGLPSHAGGGRVGAVKPLVSLMSSLGDHLLPSKMVRDRAVVAKSRLFPTRNASAGAAARRGSTLNPPVVHRRARGQPPGISGSPLASCAKSGACPYASRYAVMSAQHVVRNKSRFSTHHV